MHRLHPDPELNDDPQALLYDDCPDCDKAATNPVFRLDADRIALLFDLLVSVELNEDSYYRSVNDRKAVDALWPMYVLAERNPSLYAAIAETAAARRVSA